MQSRRTKRKTTRGVGERVASGERVTIREEDAPPPAPQTFACPPASGPRATSAALPTPPEARPEQRHRRASRRPPVTVDEVGDAALELASRNPRAGVPRLAAARPDARNAPLDPRAAYLLSRIDGATTVEGLSDVTGLPEHVVRGLLARLARLGFLAGP